MTADEAARLDADDPLAAFRSRFDLPEGVIYLDGNSLGALPKATVGRMDQVMREDWGRGLIRSWNAAGWIDAPARVGAKIARLVGAQADEVSVADSTSVNLFKLLSAALFAQPRRSVILTEPGNFPTDLYIAQGLAAAHPGVSVRTAPREKLVAAADARCVVMLTQVHYKTGERFDLSATTRALQDKGAMVLWDLSHSTGAVEVDLGAAGADLAVGCGYKYLNGGPGAPAFLFAARRHHDALRSPLTGWMGHAAPFAFGDDYAPGEGLRRFLCGTPPILGLAALESGVDLFLEVEMSEVARKSTNLCDLFIASVEAETAGMNVTLVTPREPARRGSHVSFSHPHAYPVVQAMIERGVIGDFRDPDIMRFGFAPLYNRYDDAWRAAQVLGEVLKTRVWDHPRFAARAVVT